MASNKGQFQKGCKRHPNAGIKKGQKTKKTMLIEQWLDEKGIFLPEKLEAIALEDDCPQALRVKIYSELMQYVYPKRLAQKIEATVDGQLSGHLALVAAVKEAENGKR